MLWEWLNAILVPPVAASHRPEVVVSEVAWAGSSISSSDEWLELWSGGDEVIDLAGWTLWDITADPPKLLVTIDDGQIAPDGHFLIANNQPDHEFKNGESTLAVAPDLISTDLSLSNSHLGLELRTGDDEVVDEVGDGETPLAGDRMTHASMERDIEHLRRGTRARAWKTSEAQEGFDPNVVDLGTPSASGRPTILGTDCRLVWGVDDREQPLPLVIHDPDPTTPLEEIRIDDVPASSPVLARPAAFGNRPLALDVADSSGLTRHHETSCLQTQTSSAIAISEVYAAPVPGSEEFIELANTGSEPVDLVGWQLGDSAETDAFTIPESLVLAPGERRAFFQSITKVRLNDTGETVILTDPAGQQRSRTVERARKGLSWAQADASDPHRQGSWGWAAPSPGRANVLLPEAGEENVGGAPLPATLADLVARRAPAEPGAFIELVATVTVPLGLYDERQFVVADGEWAAEVQLPEDSDVPLEVGEVVRLVGRVSRASYPRLLVDVPGIERGVERRTAHLTVDSTYEPRLLQRIRLAGHVVREQGENYLEVSGRRYQVTSRRGLALVPVGEGDELVVEGLLVELDPLRVRILTEDGLTVVQAAPSLRSDDLLGQSAPEELAEPAKVTPPPVHEQESTTASESKPGVPETIITAIEQIAQRIVGVQTALAAGTEAITTESYTAPARARAPVASLVSLFALLLVAGILADWLWEHLCAQSTPLLSSGRSPPSLS